MYDYSFMFKRISGKYQKNKLIKNLHNVKTKKNDFIYHAGTKFINNQLRSNGGRVLSITSTGASFSKIRINILKILKKINWTYGFFRKDIGWKLFK